jgi:hypothetical protein
MALSNDMTPADIAACCNGNNGFGNDSASWIIILFLFMFMGWGGNFNGFGGTTGNEVQNGFDHAAVTNGIQNLNTSVNNGFSNAEVARCNATQNILQQMNNNNSSVLQQLNTMAYNQLGNANQNQAGLADLKYTIAREACEDRSAVTSALQQLQATNNANTQAILDKLCQQEIEAKNDTIAQLRSQLNSSSMLNTIQSFNASNLAQTGQLIADNAQQTQTLINQLRTPAPVPAYIVANPNGCGCNSCCGM